MATLKKCEQCGRTNRYTASIDIKICARCIKANESKDVSADVVDPQVCKICGNKKDIDVSSAPATPEAVNADNVQTTPQADEKNWPTAPTNNTNQ